MIQTITPNPHIPCKPGWCLAYVNEAFGVPKLYGTATGAWLGSATQHRDYDFPDGVWVPLWFALAGEPAGHVVLRAPDGSVFSTSDLSTTPHHHPDLDDLIRYYAHYGMALTYLGWTEDVEGTPVMSPPGLAAMAGTITPIEEDTLSAAEVLELKLFIQADSEARHLATRANIIAAVEGNTEELKHFEQADSEARHLATRDSILARLKTELAEGKLTL
jgi:hypothetical protein